MSKDLFNLDGDVAVVTGAGRGIGSGIAKVLSQAGASVICAARRTHEIEQVAREINEAGGRAVAITTDVTDQDAINDLAQSAVDHFGKLDIWVNNAGGSPVQTPLVELPLEEWHATLALNLTAVFYSVRAAARHMGEGGRIVNVSSIASQDIFEGSGHYSAAKAGVNMLTRTLAHELGPRIRVNAVLPGFVPTEVMMAAMNLTDDDLPQLQETLNLPAGRLGGNSRSRLDSWHRCLFCTLAVSWLGYNNKEVTIHLRKGRNSVSRWLAEGHRLQQSDPDFRGRLRTLRALFSE